MRVVSQEWLNNQKKTIRDRGLLRIDFLTPQYNNNNATFTFNDTDETLSDVDVINDIYPYLAPASDNSEKHGYVGTTLTDSDGNIDIGTYQLKFIYSNSNVPLDGLTIKWSENYGYAVDFTIKINGSEYTYTNYKEKEIFLPFASIHTFASLELEINKWSEPNVPVRIEQIYAGLHLSFTGNKIFSFTSKESNNILSLELPQKEINFSLDNSNRIFDPIYQNTYTKYFSKFTIIKTYYGFDLSTGEEYIKGGTYFLKSWNAPSNSSQASFTASDVFELLTRYEYSTTRYDRLSTVDDIFINILDNYTYSEIKFINSDLFENVRKNKAVPNYSDLIFLENDLYEIYNDTYGTIKFNNGNGEFIVNINNTSSSDVTIDLIYNLLISYQKTYTLTLFSNEDIPEGLIIKLNNVSNVELSGSTKTKTFYNSYSGFNNLQLIIEANSSISFSFKLQLEYGEKTTNYHLPIENIKIPAMAKLVTIREFFQYVAHYIGCALVLDEDSNVYLYRNFYNIPNQGGSVTNNIMYTKPEFSVESQINTINVIKHTYTKGKSLEEIYNGTVEEALIDPFIVCTQTPYYGGQVTLGQGTTLDIVLEENFRYLQYTLFIQGAGTGTITIERYPVIDNIISNIQAIDTDGENIEYDNPLVVDDEHVEIIQNRALIELSRRIYAELEIRIDPAFEIFDLISFPFVVNGIYSTANVRIDELEINYNGAYKGKIKGKLILDSSINETLATYTVKSGEYTSGDETLLWHLQN